MYDMKFEILFGALVQFLHSQCPKDVSWKGVFFYIAMLKFKFVISCQYNSIDDN